MKELNIGGFDQNDELNSVSPHQEEINTLKIDKLSNRVTIISVIIPCIIGAIIIFGYLGMQETVIDVNTEKQNKIIEITDQFAQKTNALDVKLAKLESILDKTLPQIEEKIKKIDASIAKLSSKKADKSKTSKDIAKLNTANSKYTALINKIEKTSKATNVLATDAKTKFEADFLKLDGKFNSAITKINEYENLVATTSKNLSILEKKYDEFKKTSLTKSTFDTKLNKMDQVFTSKLDNLEQKLSKKIKSTPVQKAASPQKQTPPKTTGNKVDDKSIEEEAIEE